MSETLDDMEQIFLLGDKTNHHAVGGGGDWASQDLSHKDLGEFILNMHSYLVLLDYLCPPFPSRRLMQLLLGSAGTADWLDILQQLALLKLIKVKHEGCLLHHI